MANTHQTAEDVLEKGYIPLDVSVFPTKEDQLREYSRITVSICIKLHEDFISTNEEFQNVISFMKVHLQMLFLFSF